jgi:hypothetical protein
MAVSFFGSAMMSDDLAETYALVKAARSPEYNRRIAAHEAGGHAFVARALGSSVSFVTIIPDGRTEGRCVRQGAPTASLNLLDEQEQKPAATTEEIVNICTQIGPLEIGAPRVEIAEESARAIVMITELVAGGTCESVLYPDHEPLPAEHDAIEALAIASVVSSSPAALLTYCRAEAEALIRANIDIVESLTDSVVAEGALSGSRVDSIIAACIARRSLDAEVERRKAWRDITARASSFEAVRCG